MLKDSSKFRARPDRAVLVEISFEPGSVDCRLGAAAGLRVGDYAALTVARDDGGGGEVLVALAAEEQARRRVL